MKVYDINSACEALETEESVAFLTTGASMRPLLRTHKDIVVIKKAVHPLQVGEVPLYKKAGVDKLVLHRIIDVKQDGTYITRGDNTYHKEIVPQNDVVGVMVEIYRDGKYIDCSNSKAYKVYVRLNKFFYPVRFVWKAKIRAALGRIKRKIIN